MYYVIKPDPIAARAGRATGGEVNVGAPLS